MKQKLRTWIRLMATSALVTVAMMCGMLSAKLQLEPYVFLRRMFNRCQTHIPTAKEYFGTNSGDLIYSDTDGSLHLLPPRLFRTEGAAGSESWRTPPASCRKRIVSSQSCFRN